MTNMNSNMKTIIRISLVSFMVAVASCQQPFEKHYDLAVDSNAYTLSYTGDTFPLYVYCSGSWTAEFETAEPWIRIEEGTERCQGNGVARITYKDNDDDTLRQVNLILRSGAFTQTVSIEQNYNPIHLEVE